MAVETVDSPARELRRELGELPPRLRHAYAPLDKNALGLAVGTTLGLGIAGMTLWHLVVATESGSYLWLLAQFYPGYRLDWSGPFTGFLWGLWSGFATGWCAALLRNLTVGTWLFYVRSRARLSAHHHLLDHI